MKINALFIENRSNLGRPQFAGYVERFDDVAELCAYALPGFFTDKKACSLFAKKLRECFDARGDEEGFFDSINQTSLYGWSNTWKIVKNEITIYVIKNLVQLDALKPESGANESLNKLEVQDIKDKVQDWVDTHYDEYDSQDRENLLDDINNNAEMYVDMLEDTGLGKYGRETQDASYDILKEIISATSNITEKQKMKIEIVPKQKFQKNSAVINVDSAEIVNELKRNGETYKGEFLFLDGTKKEELQKVLFDCFDIIALGDILVASEIATGNRDLLQCYIPTRLIDSYKEV